MNRYIYARDNPLAFKDPDGNDPTSDWWGSKNGAIAITAATVAIGLLAMIAVSIICPALIPLAAKSVIGAAFNSIVYTLSEGEKATATGAMIASGFGAASGGAAQLISKVGAASAAIDTLAPRVVNTAAQVGISTTEGLAQDIASGNDVQFNTLSLGTTLVFNLLPEPVSKVGRFMQTETVALVNDIVFYNTDIFTDYAENVVPPIFTPIEPDWSQINIFF
jgi:hypothetical protein